MLLAVLAACGSPEEVEPDSDLSRQAGTGDVATLAASCSGCHAGTADGIPSLEGKSAEAIATSLMKYKAETEAGTVMHRLARGYSDEDVTAVSAYLAAKSGS